MLDWLVLGQVLNWNGNGGNPQETAMTYTPGGRLENKVMGYLPLSSDYQQAQNYPDLWGGIHYNSMNLGGSMVRIHGLNPAKGMENSPSVLKVPDMLAEVERKKDIADIAAGKEQMKEPGNIEKESVQNDSKQPENSCTKMKEYEREAQHLFIGAIDTKKEKTQISRAEKKKVENKPKKIMTKEVKQEKASSSMSKTCRRNIEKELVALLKEWTGKKTLGAKELNACSQLLEAMAVSVKAVINGPKKALKKNPICCSADKQAIHMETTKWLQAVSLAQGVSLSDIDARKTAYLVVHVMSSKLGTLKL